MAHPSLVRRCLSVNPNFLTGRRHLSRLTTVCLLIFSAPVQFLDVSDAVFSRLLRCIILMFRSSAAVVFLGRPVRHLSSSTLVKLYLITSLVTDLSETRKRRLTSADYIPAIIIPIALFLSAFVSFVIVKIRGSKSTFTTGLSQRKRDYLYFCLSKRFNSTVSRQRCQRRKELPIRFLHNSTATA